MHAPPKSSLSTKAETAATFLFVACGTTALLTTFAVSRGMLVLKAFCAVLQIFLWFNCYLRLRDTWFVFNERKALLTLLFLTVLPTARIFYQSASTYQLKPLTDGLFLVAPYYLLPVCAMAIAGQLASAGFNVENLITRYAGWIVAPAVLFTAFAPANPFSSDFANTYAVYDNLLLPLAMLIFVGTRPFQRNLGFCAAALTLFLSALQGSRSYFVVSVLIFISAAFTRGSSVARPAQTVLALLLVSGLLYLALSQLESFSNSDRVSAIEKFKLDSLGESFENFLRSGNPLELWYWEGNSRAVIVEQAFSDFSPREWVFGKGVFATYDSFVTRNTIEMGFAQELFWLGISHSLPFVIISLTALSFLKRQRKFSMLAIWNLLFCLLSIKLVDLLIYGLPKFSSFNCLFYLAIVSFTLSPNSVTLAASGKPPPRQRLGERLTRLSATVR